MNLTLTIVHKIKKRNQFYYTGDALDSAVWDNSQRIQ